ncbi:MAG TPA: hypothetical protein VEQ11_03900 [Chloroflexota bacterium]|nr:hypothetical protein [Chloroflexota bacterium]
MVRDDRSDLGPAEIGQALGPSQQERQVGAVVDHVLGQLDSRLGVEP